MMNPIDEPVTPMRKVVTVLGAFALGCVASVLLWNWWSARCGDACPTPSIVHMLVFLGLLPTAGTVCAVLLVSMAWPLRVKQGVAGVLLLAAVVVGTILSR